MSTFAPVPRKQWYGLIFTVFILFLFQDPWARHASALEWALTALGIVAFFALYALAMARMMQQKNAMWEIAGVTLLGVIFTPYNKGAWLLFIYATGVAPWATRGNIPRTLLAIGTIVAVAAVESLVLKLPWPFIAFIAGYSAVIGTGNTWAARMINAQQRLTQIAERERIARDMHDVLGHTLSVIILKCELAGRLVEHDPQRAKAEIADVERISRDTMAQVRETLRGYRSDGLEVEFARARATLETAGVEVQTDFNALELGPSVANALSLALREAVTNVVRHAQARTCLLRLKKIGEVCELEVHDDGCGNLEAEGNGLRGMRERIEAGGGTVVRQPGNGTKLIVTLPLMPQQGVPS